MPEEFEDKAPEGFDWMHYLALARRRSWYFLAPFFVGWLAVWGASWILPPVYRSSTLILVEQPSVPQQYVLPNVAGNFQDRLQSISEQIFSRTRLLHIIEDLNLYPKYRKRMTPDELVERMRTDIEIELVRSPGRDQLTSFKVHYSSDNPYTAQTVTRELTDLFISANLEVRQQQSEGTTAFLESQLAASRKGLSEQEEKIRQFKDRHLGELPGQLQSNIQILSGLQNELQAQHEALNRTKQQNTYIQSMLGQYRALDRPAPITENSPVGALSLDQELNRLRARFADLSSHYTDRHPDVRKLKREIARLDKMQQQGARDLKANSSGDRVSTNSEVPMYTDARGMSPVLELRSQLGANSSEIANRERAIQELQSKISAYQNRLNQEPVREQQLTDLTRGYDQSRSSYDSLLAKKNLSELATNLEKRQQGEHFSILDPASLPLKPYFPNRLKLCVIALVVGIFLGGATAAAAEVIDGRIYSKEQLKTLVPVRVLSEIPIVQTVEEEKQHQKWLWLGRVAAAIEFVFVIAGSALSYFLG